MKVQYSPVFICSERYSPRVGFWSLMFLIAPLILFLIRVLALLISGVSVLHFPPKETMFKTLNFSRGELIG